MPSIDRRAAARRKAWGRGPMILRFQPAQPEPAAPSSPEPPATIPVESVTPGPQPASMILGLRLLREIGALDEMASPP